MASTLTNLVADQSSKSARLQIELNAIIASFNHANALVPGAFRRLCQLALRWQVPAEDFRSRLVRAGLAASRASELSLVVAHPDVANQFVKSGLTWKEALTEARKLQWALRGLEPLQVAAARFIRALSRAGLREWTLPHGRLELQLRQIVWPEHDLETSPAGEKANLASEP